MIDPKDKEGIDWSIASIAALRDILQNIDHDSGFHRRSSLVDSLDQLEKYLARFDSQEAKNYIMMKKLKM